MLHRNLVCLAIAIALASPAFASESDPQPEVVVSASRVARTVDATLADVSIITRVDIEASVARDVLDLLRLEAGVDLARTGGAGGQTSVFLRGSNNNQVLVLIDGMRVAALGTGAFTWETLPLAEVERIEIVRGPRASYWGADAIGGVIQIFTRRLDGARVAVGYGSYGDAKADVGYGARGERGGFSAQVGARDVDGFPSQNENGFNYEDVDHGFRNRHLSLGGDHRFGNQQFDARYYRSQGTAEFAGGESDFTNQSLSTALEGSLGEGWQHRLSLGQAREEYATPAWFTAYLSRRTNVGWQHTLDFGAAQSLVLGIDAMHERGENRDTFGNVPVYRESRRNTGLYAGWQLRQDGLDVEAAVRHDDNSEFGGQTTGSAAIGWRFSDAARIYASYGQGFRGPTLNEQYSPGFGGLYAGNPNLDPEESRSLEAGFSWTPDAATRLDLNLYSTRLRNLISFTGENFQAENIARARVRGAELRYEQAIGDWQFSAAATLQQPRNEDTDTDLLRRPRQKLALGLDHSFGENFRVGAEVLQVGHREDVAGVRLPGYGLINLRSAWDVTPEWKVQARIENLSDHDYELAHGHNTPGRSGFVEVIWSGF